MNIYMEPDIVDFLTSNPRDIIVFILKTVGEGKKNKINEKYYDIADFLIKRNSNEEDPTYNTLTNNLFNKYIYKEKKEKKTFNF